MNIKSKVTMHDIASAVGVSVSTVSRVLDERLPPSKSAAAERIREFAKKMGYQRDYVASSLRRGDTGTIGVLVPRLTDTVTAMLYEELSIAAEKQGYFTIVATCGDSKAQEKIAIKSLLARRVDGLILSTCRLDDTLPQQLRDNNIHHSLVLRTDGVSPSVVGNDEQGAYFATRHLIDLGHTQIGLIAGPDFTSNAKNRQNGYKKALLEAGLPINNNLIKPSNFDILSGEKEGFKLLSSKHKPTAIFAINDDLAIGVMSAAYRLGIEIGKDLSLVGYNDIPLVSRFAVPLTSIRTPLEYIATQAIEQLLSQTTEPNLVKQVMPTLMPRASTVPNFSRMT